jgi:protein SCO1/2
VRFDPRDVRLALVDAASGRIGDVSDRLLLLCAHFDPRIGRHDAAVMNGLRALGLGMAFSLGAWAWRHRT